MAMPILWFLTTPFMSFWSFELVSFTTNLMTNWTLLEFLLREKLEMEASLASSDLAHMLT